MGRFWLTILSQFRNNLAVLFGIWTLKEPLKNVISTNLVSYEDQVHHTNIQCRKMVSVDSFIVSTYLELIQLSWLLAYQTSNATYFFQSQWLILECLQ